MRIGINTRFLLTDKMEGFGWYTFEICKRLVENNPQHDFVFFFDRPYDEKFVFGKNVTPVMLSPPARHPILFVLWFDLAIPRALKKHKIDVFFSPDGYLSLRTKTPQVSTIHDINFEHFPEDIPWTPRKYLRYFFPKFAKKAHQIITVSKYSKKDIVKTYSIPEEKISTIWNGANPSFVPRTEVEKQITREKISLGLPYFLFVGSLHPRKNLNRLLLAFQQFTSSNPDANKQLVIVGAALWKEHNWSEQISESTQKRVHFCGHIPLNELTQIVAAADIFTYVPYFEGFGIPLVEAMQCGVPILSGNLTSLPEVAGNAALYCDPLSIDDIAEKLNELDSNDRLKSDLIEKGFVQAKKFSWDKAADQVWEVLKRFD